MKQSAPEMPALAIEAEGSPTAVAVGKIALLVLTLASLAWFLYFAKALLLKYPTVSVDEVLFANPAINLLRHRGLSTDLLQGTLPGIGQRTYWMPPLYFLYVAAAFRIAGIGLATLRVASAFAALAVLVLTYLLSRRTGLGRWMSLLPVSLVALDTVFLRGALIGRMDMLAISFVLLALWLATRSFTPWNSFVTGIVSALAVLVHPTGVVAPAAIVLWYLLSREGRSWRSLLPLLCGMAIPFLPWLVYIARDPQSFVAQFGGQLARKAKGRSGSEFFVTSFFYLIGQYANNDGRVLDSLWALPLWFLALVGLGDTALMSQPGESPVRRSLRLLCGSQILIFLLILFSAEIWYIIYVIPLTSIGVCVLLGNSVPRSAKLTSWQGALAGLVLFCIAGFVVTNMQHTWRLNSRLNVACVSTTDYASWTSEISKRIPSGARLLLCLTPDPYFGLQSRSDLTFREYLPPVIPIDHGLYRRYLAQADYVVVGPPSQSPSPEVDDFLKSNGTLVGQVGGGDCGYLALIYRVNKPATSSSR